MAPLRIVLLLWIVAAAAATASAEQLPVQTYTTADGLGSTYIIHITQDSRGFLWFSTRDGLSRFDGYGFTTYNTTHGLPNPTINWLLETRKGIYWVATNGGGVARFDPDAVVPAPPAGTPAPGGQPEPRLFQSYQLGGALANRVNVLYEDRAGQIWVGTDGGLFRLEESQDGVTFHRAEQELPSLPAGMGGVEAILEDAEGSLWVGMGFGVLRRAPDGRSIHYTIRPTHGRDPTGALLLDREGRLWIGHMVAGLTVYKPEPAATAFAAGSATRTLLARERVAAGGGGPLALPSAAGDACRYSAADGLAHNTVQFLQQMPDGAVWAATPAGLTRFDGASFRSYTTAHGLRDNALNVLAADRDGNLWLGSPGGAMRVRPHGIITYGEADGLAHMHVHGLLEDQAGAVIAVSGRWFANRFDGQRFSHAQFSLPTDMTIPWASQAALLDRAGAWWIVTNDGLYRFARAADLAGAARRRPEAFYDSRHGLPGDSINRLFEDSRGDVWISARPPGQTGLVRWERATGELHRYSEAEGFGNGISVQSFAEDGAGRLWLGLNEGGLLRYEAGRFRLFTAGADGLPVGTVTSLRLDRKGRLWVATNEGGLGRLDDPSAEHPRFRVYTGADGLMSNNIRCLTEDLTGSIYLGTVRGVDRLDPETGHVRHYTTADGLANDFVTAALRDREGALWFGTMRGLSRFTPEPEVASAPAPAVLLANLRVAGMRQPTPELGTGAVSGLELEANQNNIQVDFFSIGFAPGEVLRYQYMVEGIDRDWGPPTNQRTVNMHLAPGTYRLLVRAVNADGVASPAPAVAAFRIYPPVWRRWWFQTLAAALFLGALVVFERYRAARFKELNVALDESQQLKDKLRGRVIELGKVNRTLALEYHLTRVLAESESLGEAAPHILHAICDSAEWEVGALWRVDEEAGVLRCVETSHLPGGEAHEFEALSGATVFARGVGLPGRVWQSGEPHWLTDLASDANFPRIAAAVRDGLRSAYGFPVLLGGRVTGVLEFFSRELRQPDEELIKWISAVGSHIGQLIERMRTEEALRASEDHFRTLTESASDAIITIDETSVITSVNPAAEAVFGYPVAELVGAPLTMLMPEYIRHLHSAGIDRYMETNRRHMSWQAVELPGLHKSGREIPLEISFCEWTKKGERFFTGIVRDVTERKQAEEALRRTREERLRELQRVRTRIASDLHDDIGSSLTKIVILSEVAQQRAEQQGGEMADSLGAISGISNELVEAMSDIVWAINPKRDHLSDLTHRMRRFASDIFTARKIKFTFHAPGAEDDTQLGANVRREVFLIFKESVNNVVKHSGAAEAHAEFRVEDGWLTLRVRDDGRGFDPARAADTGPLRRAPTAMGGNGLASMRKRAAELGGEFRVVSGAGRGTTVVLSVPVGGPAPGGVEVATLMGGDARREKV